jgi:hypothetical protein
MNNNEPSPADGGEERVKVGKEVPAFRKEDIFFCTQIGYGQRYNRHYSGYYHTRTFVRRRLSHEQYYY